MVLLTEDYRNDIKAAYELGQAILYDKPLLVLRKEGVEIGVQLRRVARAHRNVVERARF